VHGLREGFIHGGEEDQKLHVRGGQVFSGDPEQRTRVIDVVNDHPTAGEETPPWAVPVESIELVSPLFPRGVSANITTVTDPSMTWLRLPLARRNMNAVCPRYGATTAFRLKRISAWGREKRAKRSPVAQRETPAGPTKASTVVTRFAGRPAGLSLP